MLTRLASSRPALASVVTSVSSNTPIGYELHESTLRLTESFGETPSIILDKQREGRNEFCELS